MRQHRFVMDDAGAKGRAASDRELPASSDDIGSVRRGAMRAVCVGAGRHWCNRRSSRSRNSLELAEAWLWSTVIQKQVLRCVRPPWTMLLAWVVNRQDAGALPLIETESLMRSAA